MAYYNGKLATTVYFSSDGGATESVENVWGTPYPYLVGKEDPYEATVSSKISNYYWSVSYTGEQLASILQSKGYNIGTVVNVYVAEYTEMGNVYRLVFQDASGGR